MGERIYLSVVGSNHPSNIQWSINGVVVQNYVANASSGTVTPVPDLTDHDAVFYSYVVAGQSLEVSVSASVDGDFLTDSASFNVTAPNPATPTVSLPTNGQLNISSLTDCSTGISVPNLVFGNTTGPDCSTGLQGGLAGIIFSPPTTSTPPGNFFFVQLVTGDTITYSGTSGTTTCTATNTPGLDGGYPYPFNNVHTATDAPGVPLPSTYTTVSRDFAATMYLMWQSNTSGSIAVPMGSVGWSVSGSTTHQPPNGTWSTPSGSGSAQPFAPASGISSFPQWSSHVVINCH